MNTEQLKDAINGGDDTAYDLLSEKMPTAGSRFNRMTKNLAKLLDEVREHFPDAVFYTTGGDGFGLVLGDTHSGRSEKPNNELMALVASELTVRGGDW